VKLLVVVLFLALAAAGCGAERTSSPESQGNSRPATCPRGSLEGCFTYATMATYLETIEPLVARYFETQYPKLRAPRDVVYIPDSMSVRDGCGGFSTSAAYEYCPASQRIYIGQNLLWSFYKRYGDAAPVVGLAHEWGHHVQFTLGVPNPRSTADRKRFENQADCLSGAFIKYADEQDWLETDDLRDIDGLLQAIGGREGPGRDHGTAAERRTAFNQGFKSGAKACSSYFPATPVA
jgi:predicted metalloprotease